MVNVCENSIVLTVKNLLKYAGLINVQTVSCLFLKGGEYMLDLDTKSMFEEINDMFEKINGKYCVYCVNFHSDIEKEPCKSCGEYHNNFEYDRN